MIPFSVARSTRFSTSATVGTPPAFSMLCISMLLSRLSRPFSTARITSGFVCSMCASA